VANNVLRRDFFTAGAALPLAASRLLAKDPPGNPEPRRRILFLCNSLGFYAPNFFPSVKGDLRSSRYLTELSEEFPMTVFQGLYHPGMETSNHDSEKSFLTGAKKPESPHFVNTVSVDQLLARQLGVETRFPSLSFSLYDRGWGCSWDQRGSAIPPMSDVDKIYDLLFTEEDSQAKRRQLEKDQLIIDSLQSEIAAKMAVGDLLDLATYRQVLFELKRRFEREQHWLEVKKPQAESELSVGNEFPFSTKVRNLFELSRLAFLTDSTRVITVSLDWVYGAIKVPGATAGWHTLSHHGGKADLLNPLVLVEQDIWKQIAYFLRMMANTPDGNKTLLDHTTVVIGSNFGDSSNHTCDNLPTLVIGGDYAHQGHRPLDQATPLCNLWLELLHQHHVDVVSFGSSNRESGLIRV